MDGASEPRLRRWGRRGITIPAYFLMCALTLLLAPLWIPVAALIDLVRSGPRTAMRCGAFFTHYLQCQAIGIIASFVIWLASGVWAGASRERFLDWNFRLQLWWAPALLLGAARIFGFRIHVKGAECVAPPPVVLMLRHASTADTLLVSVFVQRLHRLRFRYVMKRELLWDPCLDIVGNRLPNVFVDRHSDDSAREIAAVRRLAEGLGPREGLVIYPEGTRFTPEKRARVLERLRASADPELAARAEKLVHVLPPRLGGPLAVLEANPGADVVVCAHSGFESIASFWDLWSGAIVGREIRVEFWRVPFAELPTDRAGRVDWLFDQWRRIDAWIDAGQASEAAKRR